MKALLLAALASMACGIAGHAGELNYSPGGPVLLADWQEPAFLPRQFRNHCGFVHGHFACANHCGPEFQFYYCSRDSFGCCHIGYGYCDYFGVLRCHP
jgi:hypothetical protein